MREEGGCNFGQRVLSKLKWRVCVKYLHLLSLLSISPQNLRGQALTNEREGYPT